MSQTSASINHISDHPSFEGVSQTQQKRLFYIDFRLCFLGSVNRADLVGRFGIKEAAASRDLSLYRELAPDNLEYDAKGKRYSQLASFSPVFDHNAFQTLSALQHGFGDDFIGVPGSLVTTEAPPQLNCPNLDSLSKITKAIYLEKILNVEYRSLSSGKTQREIAPFALINNGLRWHVRAFDRRSGQFRDFVINRFVSLELMEDVALKEERKGSDNQWNRIVEMQIVPHPSLKHRKTIESEYSMTAGELRVDVRAAVAGYFLRHWGVDCSERHSLCGPDVHLWLKNRQTLYGVNNLTIAPGYSDEGNWPE